MTSIREHLSRRGAEYARRAIEAYVNDHPGDFSLFAGVALELAIKAKLADANMLLLADSRSFEKSALALYRSADDITRFPPATTTVDANNALKRLIQLDPPLSGELDTAGAIAQLRNSEAHMGLGSADLSQVANLAHAINVLLDVDYATFWGEHFDFVDAAINASQDALRIRVATKKARATHRFETSVNQAEPTMRESYLAMIASRRDEAIDDFETAAADCPLCGSPALASGTTDEDVDVDWSDEGPVAAGLTITFLAFEIRCEACGLHLETPQEIQEGGHPTSWPLDVEDPDEWLRAKYGEYEPDYY